LDLVGKVAVVVGGSQGIGKAVARGLAARGAKVAIVGRSRETGESVAMAIQAAGGTAQWFKGDATEYQQMQQMAAEVQEKLGPINILVASGGPLRPRPELFLQTDPADYMGYFTNKYVTRLYALRAVVDQMIAQGKGKVVFLSTDAGRVPTPSEALVGSAAAALMFATRALGRELSRHGIRVNTVSTTLTTDTPSWDRLQDKALKEMTISKAFSKIEGRSAFGLNKPEDVAAAVLFFTGDESDQISGATISVNGGLSFP